MKKLIKLAKILLTSTIFWSISVYGSVRSIESTTKFYKAINKDLVIAHFYYKDKKVKKTPELYQKYKQVSSVFKATENIETEVYFIKINIERAHLKNLAKSYNIIRIPTFVLFSYGKEIASLSNLDPDEITVNKLKDFIWDYFENEITEKIERKAKIEEELAARRRFYYYYYGGYPIYHPFYYPPGYWGPYYRHPYYHPHYPYDGVYFGVGFRVH